MPDSDRRHRIDAAATALRRAIERTTPPIRDGAASSLSLAYRSGRGASLDDRSAAGAYAVSRMPATFASTARALGAVAERSPMYEPSTLLDVGAGTGAAAWAARASWASLRGITSLDRAASVVELGRRLGAASGDEVLASASWRAGPLPRQLPAADVVTAAYLVGELDETEVAPLVDRLWAATRGVLVLVEPGSRAGYRRVLNARDRLLGAGARVIAPCPGPEPCPIAGSRSNWCHFLARLERSPSHRRAKGATLSYEDEPFSYVALARPGVLADPRPRVVLGRPRRNPGRVELRICADGRIETRIVSRRAGDAWRAAKDLDWGDALPTDD
jgi:ribosomal protein RSM22 (predicted rRNA methylase)